MQFFVFVAYARAAGSKPVTASLNRKRKVSPSWHAAMPRPARKTENKCCRETPSGETFHVADREGAITRGVVLKFGDRQDPYYRAGRRGCSASRDRPPAKRSRRPIKTSFPTSSLSFLLCLLRLLLWVSSPPHTTPLECRCARF